MENKSHALIAGLFTLVLGVVLVAAALWLSRDTTERVPYELLTRASIAGLSSQSTVKYRGLEVGKVERISFDPEVPGQIIVRIAVEKGTPLTRSTYATLGYQGVTGLAYIQLDDKGASRELLDSKPGAVARIDIAPGLLDTFTARGEAILTQVEEVAKRLTVLLDPANQKILAETLVSLGAAARDVNKLTVEVQPVLAAMPDMMRDTRKTLVSVANTGDEFARLAARLQERGGAIERVSASLENLATTGANLSASLTSGTLPRLQALVETLNTTTLPHVNTLVDTLIAGTLPRVNTLVDSAGNTLRGVGRLIDTVDERPQSLLFGPGEVAPGPGEPGFVAPGGGR